GNGGSPLLIRQAEIDAMMAAGETAEIPWVVRNPVYEAGAGPATIKVIDPLNVRGGSYTLRMLDTVTQGLDLAEAHWVLTGGSLFGDTLNADRSIAVGNEQLIPELGISIEIEQVAQPGDAGSSNNGLIGGAITFANPRAQWLSGVADQDGNDFQNWIRSGTSDDPDSDDFDDWPGLDPEQDYEGILGGTWAPFRLTASHTHGPIANDIHAVVARLDRLQSVSIFITNDRSKWSRVPVLEMQDVENLAQGGTGKGFLRSARSVDKNGNPADSGAVGQDQVEDLATYIGATGMGWFPGYAINLETGERLNMAFGEDSWLAAENGQDMLWNPTSSVVEQLFREVRFGGKHYVYVFRNNSDLGDDQMPGYDAGKFMHDILINANAPVEPEVRNIWSAAMWVGLPLVAEGETLLDNDLVVDLLVGKPYSTQVFKRFTDSYLTPNSSLTPGRYYYVNSGPVFHEGDTFVTGQSFVAQSNTFTAQVGLDNLLETQNGGLPLYNFSLDGLQVINNDNALLDDALEDINIVPNPYYAFSDYEADALDNRVRIINLPRVANVNIYTVNGTLVRAFKKDDPTITSLDWDLKNTANIPIASGVYIVHVEVPGVGEKILKWFGLARTIDLDSF
ncbi:MAG: T9SS type A sorting domain-containing protein, partial [Bacteroidota bacterium]